MMGLLRIQNYIYDTRCKILVGAAVISLIIPSVGKTQEPLPKAEQTALARSLFHKGIGYLEQRQWEQAADFLGRSLALHRSSVVAYNLALALEPQGELVKASELLRNVVRDETAQPQLRQTAQELLDQLSTRIGALTVVIQGDADSVALSLDERALLAEAIGVAVPIDPGRHRAVASRNGKKVASAEVIIREGESGELVLAIPPKKTESKVDVSPQKVAHPDQPEPILGQKFHQLRDEESMDSIFMSGWFWVGAGTVLAAVISIAVISEQSE